MKILSVAGCPYEDYEGQILHLETSIERNEKITVGDEISIEMMDDTFLYRKVKLINPKYAGDYHTISKKTKAEVESGKCRFSENPTLVVEGPCVAELVVVDVPYHEVKTDEEIRTRQLIKEMQSRICLTPYKELHCGSKSIYDYINESFIAPDRVIAYLRTTIPYLMNPGIYKHPFKPDKDLLGPYMYTDGKYYWDRDTWKYVVKYHLVLPQDFIDHVMSDEGDKFYEEFIESNYSWSERIKEWKKKKGVLCLLPNNAGDTELTDF